MRPLHYYLAGTGSWFLAFGMQGVMFAWLVTMVLRETPEKIGVAQMSLLLPGTLLILIGGSYADRFGARRVALLAQSLAALSPLLLLAVVATDRLTFAAMIGYAVLMGCAQAFVTPARDGLLSQVAEGRVQRAVVLTSLFQFGLQVVGFVVASLADVSGAEPILLIQALVLVVGAFGLARIRNERHGADLPAAPLLRSLREGGRTVFSSPPMRMIVVQNAAMAFFFMGSYIVTMPILVREVYAGSATELGLMNAANSLGLFSTVILLLRFGDVRRQGRALLLAQAIGGTMLAVAALAPSFPVYLLTLFLWGACGGIAMTMSRTIMQEQAPLTQRSRVMSFYSFSFFGAGPIGALLNGFLVEQVGPQGALLICGAAMLTIAVMISALASLWHLDGQPSAVREADAATLVNGARSTDGSGA
ncbi:MAG TPA: MFS transporter [Pseudomonadales bacterium]